MQVPAWIESMIWKANAFLNKHNSAALGVLQNFTFLEWAVLVLSILLVIFLL